jgi:hypothetical protein
LNIDIAKEAERRALERFRTKVGNDALIPVEGQDSLAHVHFWEALYRDAINELATEAKSETDNADPEVRKARLKKGCVMPFLALLAIVFWSFLIWLLFVSCQALYP